MKVNLSAEDEALIKAGRGSEIPPRDPAYDKAVKHAISKYKWFTPVGVQSANRGLIKAESAAAAGGSKAAEKLAKAQRKAKYRSLNHVMMLKNGAASLMDGIVWAGPFNVPVGRVELDVIGDGPGERITATRVAAGALLAGPIGALVGAMAHKETVGMWLVIRDAETGKSAKVGFLSSEAPIVDDFVGLIGRAKSL